RGGPVPAGPSTAGRPPRAPLRAADAEGPARRGPREGSVQDLRESFAAVIEHAGLHRLSLSGDRVARYVPLKVELRFERFSSGYDRSAMPFRRRPMRRTRVE